MGRSESADKDSPGRVRTWIVVSPLWISFAALQPGLWGIDWCEGQAWCDAAASGLSWIGVGFPHALAAPLAILVRSTPTVFGAALVADLILTAVILARRPRWLAPSHAAAILGGWLGLTLLSVYLAPFLLVAAWRLSPSP